MPIDFAADAAAFSADFGELVTYRPFGRTARTITANVFREDPSLIDGLGGGQATVQFVVIVSNSSDTGISRDELDMGRDQIELAASVGGSISPRKITNVLTQDEGMLQLIVR